MSKLDKSALRQKLLQQRNEMSVDSWSIKSQMICDRLKSSFLLQKSSMIFAYFSFRQEPELGSLFSLQKSWVFPRCVNKSLIWHLWTPGAPLKTNKYGIKEPLETARLIEPNQADLILLPSVSIDSRGYRLGYGGGFYDRLLSSSQCLNIPTIAVLFDLTCVDYIPVDPWDQKTHFFCTETRFKSFSNNS